MNDGRRIPKAEPGFATRHTIPEEELEMLVSAANSGGSLAYAIEGLDDEEVKEQSQIPDETTEGTILLIDDEEKTLAANNSRVKAGGFSVVDYLVTGNNLNRLATDIRRIIRRDSVDIVLLDVNIDPTHGMESGPALGYSLAKMITDGIIHPVVLDFYSGYRDEKTIERMIGENVDIFPIAPGILLKNQVDSAATLKKYLTQRLAVLDIATPPIEDAVSSRKDYMAIAAAVETLTTRLMADKTLQDSNVQKVLKREYLMFSEFLGKDNVLGEFTYNSLIDSLRDINVQRVYGNEGNSEGVGINVVLAREGAWQLKQTLRRLPDLIEDIGQKLAVCTTGQYNISLGTDLKEGLLRLTFEAEIRPGQIYYEKANSVATHIGSRGKFKFVYCGASKFGVKAQEATNKFLLSVDLKDVYVPTK